MHVYFFSLVANTNPFFTLLPRFYIYICYISSISNETPDRYGNLKIHVAAAVSIDESKNLSIDADHAPGSAVKVIVSKILPFFHFSVASGVQNSFVFNLSFLNLLTGISKLITKFIYLLWIFEVLIWCKTNSPISNSMRRQS